MDESLSHREDFPGRGSESDLRKLLEGKRGPEGRGYVPYSSKLRSKKKLKIHEPNHCFVTGLLMPALDQEKEMEGEECLWEGVTGQSW